MDHIEALFHDLSRLSTSMEALEKKPNADVFYDLLSGAFIWEDELPQPDGVSLDCLRFVFKYRTGLIIGEIQSNLESFWEEAILRFPNWIGFSAERVEPNEVLAIQYFHKQQCIVNDTEWIIH